MASSDLERERERIRQQENSRHHHSHQNQHQHSPSQSSQHQQSQSQSQSSCRTPGMAGKKALVTFRITLPPTHRPPPQKIALYGSWTSYTTPLAMERDVRAGHGIWKSGGPKGGLEQGAAYGYYYVFDGKTVWYDPAAGRTVRDDRTGRVVNVVEVPIELASEEDDNYGSRGHVGLGEMREQGKERGGGEVGSAQNYERSSKPKVESPRRKPVGEGSPRVRKEMRGPAPPPVQQQVQQQQQIDSSSSSPGRRIVSDGRRIKEQGSLGSLKRFQTESSSASSGAETPRHTHTKQKPNPISPSMNFPPLKMRRKPVPTHHVSDGAIPIQLPSMVHSDAIRKSSYTFLGRKISIPSLPPTPTPVPDTPNEHMYSSSYNNAQNTIQIPDMTDSAATSRAGYDDSTVSSKKESSANNRRRWTSFLPTPINVALASRSDESPQPSPRKRIGRLFSLAKSPNRSNDVNQSTTTVSGYNASQSSLATTTGSGGTLRGNQRTRNTPSPLDIPPPPEFVRRRFASEPDPMDVDVVETPAGSYHGSSGAMPIPIPQQSSPPRQLGVRRSMGPGIGGAMGRSQPIGIPSAEGRVRNSFLPDRETRIGNLLGQGRLNEHVYSSSLGSIGGGPGAGGPSSSFPRHSYASASGAGNGFVMVGQQPILTTTGDGTSLYGHSYESGGYLPPSLPSQPPSLPASYTTTGLGLGYGLGVGLGYQASSSVVSTTAGSTETKDGSGNGVGVGSPLPEASSTTTTSATNTGNGENAAPKAVSGFEQSLRAQLSACAAASETWTGQQPQGFGALADKSTAPVTPDALPEPRESINTPTLSSIPAPPLDFTLPSHPFGGSDLSLSEYLLPTNTHTTTTTCNNTPPSPLSPTTSSPASPIGLNLDYHHYPDHTEDEEDAGVALAEGDAGTYDCLEGGGVKYVRSLKCLREESVREGQERRDMWEELGWLGGAVV